MRGENEADGVQPMLVNTAGWNSRAQHAGRPWPAIIYALALLALTTLPYLLAWSQPDASWRFSGFLIGVEDSQSYIAKMRQGAAGQLDFTLVYTTEPHQPAVGVYLHYLLPGWVIGRFIPESSPALTPALIAAFHALRLAAAAVYLAVLYRFISAFVLTVRLRLLAFVLATIGGGLGWLLLLTGTLPPEFFLPEGFGFLSLLAVPHLLLARAALLGGLLLLMRAAESGRWRPAVGAGLCWALMAAIVPFYLAVVYALLGAWIGLVWLRARAFPARLLAMSVAAGGLTLPLFAFYLLQFGANPAMAAWSAQNLLPTPAPLVLILAYLPLLIAALTALPFVWASAYDKGRLNLLLAWVLIAPILAYLPINVQRRLLEGVLIPLALLAAIGLAGWARHGRAGQILAGGTFAAACLSSLLLLMGSMGAALNPAVPAFRPAGEATAFAWLNGHAPRNAVALSSFETGNALPAFTHLRPFVGHGPETIAASEKAALAEAFFQGSLTAAEQAALLAGPCIAPAPLACSDPIDFVLFGPLERARSHGEAVEAWASGLTLIYDEAGYRIYAVR